MTVWGGKDNIFLHLFHFFGNKLTFESSRVYNRWHCTWMASCALKRLPLACSSFDLSTFHNIVLKPLNRLLGISVGPFERFKIPYWVDTKTANNCRELYLWASEYIVFKLCANIRAVISNSVTRKIHLLNCQIIIRLKRDRKLIFYREMISVMCWRSKVQTTRKCANFSARLKIDTLKNDPDSLSSSELLEYLLRKQIVDTLDSRDSA